MFPVKPVSMLSELPAKLCRNPCHDPAGFQAVHIGSRLTAVCRKNRSRVRLTPMWRHFISFTTNNGDPWNDADNFRQLYLLFG
jgi:hypothetical protein